MKRKQIGIFPGTFNPLHMGHLMIAGYMKEFTSLEEIWFVVSPHSPGKERDVLLDGEIRLEMAKMILKDFDKLKVSDIEFHMPFPSYTMDTLARLTSENPDTEFSLIIGADKWKNLPQWKGGKQLLNDYNILIYPRLGSEIYIPAEFSKNVHLVDAPIIEISSTFIRKSLREGKKLATFVPSSVYDFIEKNGFYQ